LHSIGVGFGDIADGQADLVVFHCFCFTFLSFYNQKAKHLYRPFRYFQHNENSIELGRKKQYTIAGKQSTNGCFTSAKAPAAFIRPFIDWNKALVE